MRVFYAYFLLAITALQWVGGVSWYRVIHTKAIIHAMNIQEKAIADAVEEETGMQVSIEVLAKDQLTPRGLIYSDFFAFAHPQEEDTVYFAFRHKTVDFQTQIQDKPVSPKDQEQEVLLVQGLFQNYLAPLPMTPLLPCEDYQISYHFYTAMQSNDHHRLLTPPPQQM